VLAVGALLLMQVGQCTATALDEQSMECCHSMHCTPLHSCPCCKKMVSGETPNMLPSAHVSLHAPMIAAVVYPLMLEIFRSTTAPALIVDAQEHSPPADLYTLNLSLLI
jgi:hypothetical protein